MIRMKGIVFWGHIHVFIMIVRIFELLGQFIFNDNETGEKGREFIGKRKIENW